MAFDERFAGKSLLNSITLRRAGLRPAPNAIYPGALLQQILIQYYFLVLPFSYSPRLTSNEKLFKNYKY